MVFWTDRMFRLWDEPVKTCLNKLDMSEHFWTCLDMSRRVFAKNSSLFPCSTYVTAMCRHVWTGLDKLDMAGRVWTCLDVSRHVWQNIYLSLFLYLDMSGHV